VKQVRLVAQPVRPGTDGGVSVTTGDTAIHLLYALSDSDFATVDEGLHKLKALAGAATDGQPLDVHPVMATQGLGGAYARALDELVLGACGQDTLVRIAFMKVNGQDTVWTFGAFDVRAGALSEVTIPRLGTHTLQGFQEFGNEAFRAGTLMPAAPNDDFPTLLSETEVRLADEGLLSRAFTSALELEHPLRSSPKTVDCASCHAASRARRHAEQSRTVDNSQHPDAFHAARFNLTRVDGAGDNPRAQRAFGYFGAQTALSQRTINESAQVAEALSR
jgi:hypothetical protein